MSTRSFVFTSESVSEGHPDKLCDQVSDAVVDAALAIDPEARVACETLAKTGFVTLAGEIFLHGEGWKIDYPKIAREVITGIGYDNSACGFDGNTCGVLIAVEEQSGDIRQGVERGDPSAQGAGDQGLMFGYACRETPELMPMPIIYAHRLTERLARLRKERKLAWLRPDAKSQVSVRYENGSPVAIDAVVVSTQHSDDVNQPTIREAVMEEVIHAVIPASLRATDMKVFVNPTGRFVIGGPMGDAGVTGRKIIVDTYGGMGRHGGGAFSGKDPSKVDRSAAYMGRYVAKNLVAAGLAERCEVQVAYAIGVAEPVSVLVNTFGTGVIEEQRIEQLVVEKFRLRPWDIISTLNLRRPIYRATAAYGHFGRELPDFTWERTDRAAELRDAAGLR